MPLPPPVPQLFEKGLGHSPSQADDLDTLIRKQLELAVQRLDDIKTTAPSASGTKDLLSEVGDYFVRTALIWSQLAENMLQGPHVIQASQLAHERAEQKCGLSDYVELYDVDARVFKLRAIWESSKRFSAEVQNIWEPVVAAVPKDDSSSMQTVPSPCCETKMSSASETLSSAASDSDPSQFTPHSTPRSTPRKLLPDKSQVSQARRGTFSMTCSDDSSSDDEQFQAIDMDALRQRGKGNYYCPKGDKCDKGGVDRDGKLVVFDRNSSFVCVSTPNYRFVTQSTL
ncbi:hypothetical protein QQS21_006256 [Conoideocrella luteorostrata]|uniref:Uncharacterized protein n=1 Tax=Conoideocrella luteorostrata TaxID=1105319 RepID=A0AAJ0CNB4_9HYPO|nr:hypothetical protein QQS21_006256 [Conoideocrella luteorostrata]